MLNCRLQLIDDYPFDISKESNHMALNYTCFTDQHSAQQLEIVGHGFRYLSASNIKKLVMVISDERLKNREDIVIKVPFTIYQYFKKNMDQIVTITREPMGLINQLIPKIESTKEINVYFNANYPVDQALIKFISKEDFVCQTGEYFIDCHWFEKYLSNFGSMRAKLEWQRAINEREGGRYVSYLRFFIEIVEKTPQARLFRKGETKLTLKQQALHPCSLYKTINLNRLQLKIMRNQQYENTFSQLARVNTKRDIIVLQTDKDINLEGFLHYYAQQVLNINFKCIDCQNVSSTKEFWLEMQSITQLQDILIFIRNIAWIEELYQSQQMLNFEMKTIVKKLEKQYNQLLGKSLRKYYFVVQHIGQNSIHEHFQSAKRLNLHLNKTDRIAIYKIIFDNFDGEHPLRDEIIAQFHDKFGWQVFQTFMAESWPSVKHLSQSEIFKKLRELVKQEQVENLIEVSWDDVGGLQTAKEEIIQTVLLPIKHPQIFDQRIKPRTGLLFYGPPGTGKTLLGKCVAKQCKMNFISVKGPELLNMYVGESEKNVRAVFERARACSPCIVFMDELDALVPKRGNSGDSNQVMDRIVAELLQQMDTASENQVFIIGATNRPDLLDPSILRGGRFDKQIYLGITQAHEDRIKIIKAQTRHLTLEQNLNWDKILEHIPKNFTGADFYGLTSKAVMAAAERTIQEYQRGQIRQKITLREQDFISAASGIKSSVTQADLARYQQLRKIYS